MIQSISIENYRGIRKGQLQDLPAIAVLTGPNGCGKSSVLEALQIGAEREATADVLARRDQIPGASRWLIHRGEFGSAKFVTHWSDGAMLKKRLSVSSSGFGSTPIKSTGPEESWKAGVIFIEQRAGRPRSTLHQLFSETRRRAGVETAIQLLAEVDPTIRGLEILTEGDTPVLHVAYADRVVPAALAGDGMESLVRLALELSQTKAGTFLIEEPEAHLHSAAILSSAKMIVTAARLGCQVILSTHSMELLDGMLSGMADDELAMLAVFRMRLTGGELKVLRMAGSEVNAARTEIADDLR